MAAVDHSGCCCCRHCPLLLLPLPAVAALVDAIAGVLVAAATVIARTGDVLRQP